ncbi:M48 family metallopeptidase [Belliella sp. R4-6]|uniref:M48 family metallopeptidase n=1 Tax=Belliella alkalica TaxID=1730871 RepID=A0ABS9V942_9BACT|nr:M48 family metallopeptidase [Belliella alkalica]MCH7412923.1 M48 family metallopeptidase [Belliella alkalica]
MIAIILSLFLIVPEIEENHTDSIADVAQKSEYLEVDNKRIPWEIKDAVVEALAYFPELAGISIDFEFKEKISGAVMQAQPRILTMFVTGKEKREYRIKITRAFEFEEGTVLIEEVPHDALVGWIGHELGHIMDYKNRSTVNMMHFGMRYMLSNKRLTEAELAADTYAISCGMGHQILTVKNYILNNDNFKDSYKNKIRDLYMSPLQILSLQEELLEDEG